MSRRSRRARNVKTDSFQNVAARLGIGTDNLQSDSRYAFNPITRARQDLEFMYRGSWFVGRVVDCVAEDMTRAGIDINTQQAPDVIGALQKAMRKKRLWAGLTDTIRWSRLYGGAGAIIMIEGQDVSTPLRPETVGRGQFKGIYALDRWVIQPTYDRVVKDMGPEMGKPEFYKVLIDIPPFTGKEIHHTRFLRFDGIPLPYWQRTAEQGWGMSVVERMYDRMVAFDSTTQGTAQLVHKAYLRTVRVKDLRQILGAGGPAEAALIKNFEMIRRMQSSEGLTLLDAEDSLDTHQYTFSGLSDVLYQFAEQLSASCEIPLVRLFGQSPAGLNSSGESDLRSYYDLIAQQQENRLRTPVETVVDLTFRSEIDGDVPDDLEVKFNPLWQMSDTDKANISSSITTSIMSAYTEGVVDKPTAMKELRQSADITGVWSNITDEMIKDAEDEPPEPVLQSEGDREGLREEAEEGSETYP